LFSFFWLYSALPFLHLNEHQVGNVLKGKGFILQTAKKCFINYMVEICKVKRVMCEKKKHESAHSRKIKWFRDYLKKHLSFLLMKTK